MNASEHAIAHAAGLSELADWKVGDVGQMADGRIGFVVDVPFRVVGTGRKARVYAARREIRSFDDRGTMFVTVVA